VALRMPTKTNSWREVILIVGQGLPVIAKTKIQGQIGTHFPIILHEPGQEPLLQFIAVDAEVNRLRVVLHVSECQLTEWRGRRILEREGAENRRAGFAARAA